LVGLLELADHSVGSPAELEEVFRAPLLGVIPEDSALAAPFRTASGRGLIDADEEVFHLLRAHLRYFNLDRELRSILVCSSGPGEGKTTVAAHLASAMAAGGARVLLVEADLRLPVMSARLNIRQAPGLADVVVGRVGLQDAVQTVPVPGDEGGLCVLVAGAMPPNPTQMLESEAMARVLAEASNDFDMVIVDSAPLLSVADTIGLLKRVDGVIVVTMLGKSRSDVASRTAAMLRRVGAPLLGVVANGVRGAELAPYRYGYSYGPRARAAAGPVSGTLAELDRERGNPRA
jgi:receptor protein-tyrosine kinase